MFHAIPEKEIHPVVAENVAHNTAKLSFVRNMTCPIFGIVAGTLGLTSYLGFLFYLTSFTFISGLVFVVLMHGRPGKFIVPQWSVWTSHLGAGLPSYILTWTLFYGLVHVYD